MELGGLRSYERVYDVGCGIGRMADTAYPVPGRSGLLRRLDVLLKGIARYQENITPRHPNFRFQIADIRNKEYNLGTRVTASEY